MLSFLLSLRHWGWLCSLGALGSKAAGLTSEEATNLVSFDAALLLLMEAKAKGDNQLLYKLLEKENKNDYCH